MARKKGKCVYCGEYGRMTSDHVPPKCIFAEPYPPNLATVPCCDPCRRKSEKDDEYFCHRVLSRADIGHRADVRALQDRIVRALSHPQKRGYRKEFHASLSLREVRTLAGLYLGHVPTYTVENKRLDAVASRIVRGLYFRERSRRLPRAYLASVWSLEGLIPEAVAAIEREFVRPLLHVPERVIGDRVFGYRFVDVGDGPPHTTAWLLRFFERVIFFGFTIPPDESPAVEPKGSGVARPRATVNR